MDERIGVIRGCLLARVRVSKVVGGYIGGSGVVRRGDDGKDARVEGMRVEGEWVNCKTRSSVFLS